MTGAIQNIIKNTVDNADGQTKVQIKLNRER